LLSTFFVRKRPSNAPAAFWALRFASRSICSTAFLIAALRRLRVSLFLAILCVAISSFVGSGCRPDNVLNVDSGFGPFEGEWDGRAWRGRGYVVLTGDSLFLFGHRRPVDEQFYDEIVRVSIAFNGVGSYTIVGEHAQLGKVVGGDAGYFTSASGVLEIARADRINLRAEGTLELRGQSHDGTWRLERVTFNVPIYTRFDQPPRWF
jgi:hypothetical protein